MRPIEPEGRSRRVHGGVSVLAFDEAFDEAGPGHAMPRTERSDANDEPTPALSRVRKRRDVDSRTSAIGGFCFVETYVTTNAPDR